MTVNNPFAAKDQMFQQILQDPWLPQIASQLQSILKAEQEKRRLFYEEMSEGQKTEFINGEVIVQPPAELRHSQVSEFLFSLLSLYVNRHNLGYVGHEKLLVCLTRNDYEPDICFFGNEKAQAFTRDQIKFPAPDMVVEILSASTEAIDRGVKFDDYALHGVKEYWIIDPRPDRESVEQYLLKEDGYELEVKDKTGTIRSKVVNEMMLPTRAIFDKKEYGATAQMLVGGE